MALLFVFLTFVDEETLQIYRKSSANRVEYPNSVSNILRIEISGAPEVFTIESSEIIPE